MPEPASPNSVSERGPMATKWATRVWKRPLVAVLILALASRLFFIAITMVSFAQVDEWPPGAWQRGPTWVQPFVRWDSAYYLDIAAQGYGERPELWAFHPAYPMLIRGIGALAPALAPEAIGFFLSNLCFLAAAPLFYQTTERMLGAGMALRATAILCWFPGGFFFTAVYSESLFFLLMVGAIGAFHQGRWASAGLLAAATNAARPQGLFLAPAFAAVLAWQWLDGRRPQWRSWLAPGLAGTFIVAHSAFAWWVSGDPLAWMNAREAHWPDVGWRSPFATIDYVFMRPDDYGLSFLGLTLLGAASTFAAVWFWRTHPRLVRGTGAAHAFTAILVLVYLVYAATPSLLRFCLASFSLFWGLAHVARSEARLVAILAASAVVGAIVAYTFATWGPAF